MTDYKTENELLRAQLIQCTTAMLEVCTRLENANLDDDNEVIGTVNWCFDKLYEARGKPVDSAYGCKDQAEKIKALGQQVRQAGDSLAEAHRRRELAARQCEELKKEKQQLLLSYLALEGRNSELALEITKLRAYKKRFIALAVEFDEEPEA